MSRLVTPTSEAMEQNKENEGDRSQKPSAGLSAVSPHRNAEDAATITVAEDTGDIDFSDPDAIRVEVQGAGFIRFDHYGSRTGSAIGFHVGASWSRYGEHCGGVMDRAEAVRLAWDILKTVRLHESEYPEWVKNRDEAYASSQVHFAQGIGASSPEASSPRTTADSPVAS